MKKLIGWPLANTLYYIGHLAYLILDAMPDSDSEELGRVFRFFWRVYQGSMALSLYVNEWADLTAWTKPRCDTQRNS